MSDLKGKSDKYIAALAVRKKSLSLIEEGLNSLFRSNATDDYRDIISGLALYYDALNRIGENADLFLEKYSDDNSKNQEIIDFLSRDKEDKDLSIFGYKVVFNPEFNYEFSYV